MRITVVGCGQCGGRIADEFCRLSIKARVQRGIEITAGVFAVNTDIADLSGLKYIKPDYHHRILIGNQKTGGHGVGKINELGAEVALEEGDKVIDAIRGETDFPETDAFVLISSAAGGTGSGAIPALSRIIKERYLEKPVYNIIVLPFAHEESTEQRTIYNTATCLKSTYLVADAVFLVDNQRFVKKNFSIGANLTRINRAVVEPFYDLLCAGEEKKIENIGSKILDAGDIIQTLSGWTIIGQSTVRIPRFIFPWFRTSSKSSRDFRNKATETNRGLRAMHGALSELSLKCNPADARRGLYLLCAPPKEMNMELIKNLGALIKTMATEAVIRTGDYPRNEHNVNVTVILSELANVGKVMDYFTRALNFIYTTRKRREGVALEHKSLEDTFRDIPSLLQ
ncbi:MAG: tubulin/FtsZ family protein [Chloroflexota bacterium]